MIRRASLADADAIARVHAEAWRETYTALVPADQLRKHDLDAIVAQWPAILGRQRANGRSVHVAEENGRVVGFASGGPATTPTGPYTGELYSIYLLRGAHKAGAGRSLVNAVAADLAAAGHRAMMCWVLASNPARGFYERLGGREIGGQVCATCGQKEVSYGWELSPRIRRARLADVDEIARVHVEAWRETYDGLVPEWSFTKHDLAERRAQWPRVIQQQGEAGRGVHVAERDGRVVGFASGGPAMDQVGVFTGELYSIYLLRAGHKGGAGRALVAAVARDLHEAGHRAMMCWVLGTNPARGFYERIGGREIARRLSPDDGLEDVAYGWDDITSLTPYFA